MRNAPNKKALIIGAGSQDGILLARKLTKQGWDVMGVQNPNSHTVNVHFAGAVTKTNFIDTEKAFQLLNAFQPETIFHFATFHSNSINIKEFENTYRDQIITVNYNITKNIIDWQKKENNAKNSKSLIALSSKMYDSVTCDTVIDLDTPFNPSGLYGETKIRCYEEIKMARSNFGIESSGLILFNHTSRFSKKEFLIPTLVHKLKNLLQNNKSSLTIERANYYVDISDAQNFVDGFVNLANEYKNTDYIFSSGKALTITEIVTSALKEIDERLLDRIKFVDSLPGNFAIYGDISRTKQELNWMESISIDETIIEMMSDFED
jgi:GDP-D-mannose dehydratase